MSLAIPLNPQYNERKPISKANIHNVQILIKERDQGFMATIDNPGNIAVRPPSTPEQQRLSLFDQVNLNVFWIANNFQVYLSGAMMTIVCIIFIIFQNQYAALIAGAFFGIGYGAYTSVDWALMTDVLPPTDEAGKFMGIWSAMGILPQVVGITVGGIVLQLLHALPNHIGYTTLFLVTIVYFGLGTLVIRQVKGLTLPALKG